jgi:ketosteroid isomerase-like protein
MKTPLLAVLPAIVLSAAAPTSDQEEEVMAAMNTWIDATVKQDVDALEKILHDELSYTHSNARTQTKAEVVQDAKEGRGPAGIELAETTVRIYGNTALVKSMVTVRGRPRGQAQNAGGNAGLPPGAARGPAPLSILHVLVKGPQGWQLAARQATRPGPPPGAPAPGR